MALSGSTLKAAIKSAVDAIDVDNGEITNDAILQAVADAIVDHIKNNGQVIVGSGSSAGVYSIT